VFEPDLLTPARAIGPPWWLLGLATGFGVMLSWALRPILRARAFPAARRWLPVAEILVWTGVIALWVRRYVWTDDALALGRGVLLLVLVLVALPWLRGLLYSVVLAFEDRFRVGDDLRVGELEGRIARIGSRVVVLRAPDGTEVSIPHVRLFDENVVRINRDVRDAPCEIETRVPARLGVARALEIARVCAALSPYAAPHIAPQVFLLGGERDAELRIRVRGFVFDKEHEHRYRSDVVARIAEHTALATT
jgi:small-conductance mechanosensitive channel